MALEYFDRALHLCRTEMEAVHTFGLRLAAESQMKVVNESKVPMIPSLTPVALD